MLQSSILQPGNNAPALLPSSSPSQHLHLTPTPSPQPQPQPRPQQLQLAPQHPRLQLKRTLATPHSLSSSSSTPGQKWLRLAPAATSPSVLTPQRLDYEGCQQPGERKGHPQGHSDLGQATADLQSGQHHLAEVGLATDLSSGQHHLVGDGQQPFTTDLQSGQSHLAGDGQQLGYSMDVQHHWTEDVDDHHWDHWGQNVDDSRFHGVDLGVHTEMRRTQWQQQDRYQSQLEATKAEIASLRQAQSGQKMGLIRLHDQVVADLAAVVHKQQAVDAEISKLAGVQGQMQQETVQHQLALKSEMKKLNQTMMTLTAVHELASSPMMQDEDAGVEERLKRRQAELEAALNTIMTEMSGEVERAVSGYNQLSEKTQQLELRCVEITGRAERADKSQQQILERIKKIEDLQNANTNQGELLARLKMVEETQKVTAMHVRYLEDELRKQAEITQLLRQEAAEAFRQTDAAHHEGMRQFQVALSQMSITHQQHTAASHAAPSLHHQSPHPPQHSHHTQHHAPPTSLAASTSSTTSGSIVTLNPGLRLKKGAATNAATPPAVFPVQTANVDQERMTVHVRAVQTAPLGHPAALLPSTVASALVGKEPAKFSGNSEAWSQWRRRWLAFVREVEEVYPTISSRQRLTLLRS